MQRLIRILTVCLLLTSGPGLSVPNSYPMLTNLETVGQGRLSWFGITIYRATLYGPKGLYQAESEHALKITYKRSFTSNELANVSVDEMEKIQGKKLQRQEIVTSLSALLSDVQPDDYLISRHVPGEGAQFYNRDGFIGRLSDPDLAQAFFDIWLHPDTSQPRLRRDLMGNSP